MVQVYTVSDSLLHKPVQHVMEEPDEDNQIRATLLQLLQERGPEKTACPSAVAKEVARTAKERQEEAWRDLMPQVLAVARQLAETGRIEVTQGGQPVRIDEASGPVRLGLRSDQSDRGETK